MDQRVVISWQDGASPVFSVELDATTSEKHGAPNTVTEHPVEKGANIADHIRAEALTLSLTGVISNTPVTLPQDHTGSALAQSLPVTVSWDGYDNRGKVSGTAKTLGSVAALPPILGAIQIGRGDDLQIGHVEPAGTETITANGFSAEFDRVKEVDKAFLDVRTRGLLCKIVTTLRMYENMAVVTYDIARDKDSGHALMLSFDFKQIRLGSTESVPVPSIPVTKTSKGKAVTHEAPANAVEDSSLAFQAFGKK